MKCIYTLCVLVAIVRAGGHENHGDIDALLTDDTQFEGLITCFLDTAPCSDVAGSFKKDIPAALLHSCENCTPVEKHIVNLIFAGFKKKPQQYEAFKDIYDPKKIYLDKLAAAVAGF